MGFSFKKPFRKIKRFKPIRKIKKFNPVKKGKKVLNKVDDLPEKVLKEVPKLVEKALLAAVKEAQKGVLKKAVRILEATAPDGVDLTIGPIGLMIEDVHGRMAQIKRWARNPPSKKSDIRKMIETIGPTSVSVNLSVELALVVVASDSLALGMSMEWETKNFLDRFGAIMKGL